MSNIATKLKAPFPYFGGKSRVASIVWARLGDVDNFIEPFCGSAATLLGRPLPPRIETINDADCMVANFWRATKNDADAVADAADNPVNEADLHARHRWLVLSDEAKAFRKAMRSDPDYFDPKVAGWWCWGLCCWIGSGWCDSPKDIEGSAGWKQTVRAPDREAPGCGVNGVHKSGKRVKLSGSAPGSVENGTGVNAAGPQSKRMQEKRPRVQRTYSDERVGDLPGVIATGLEDRVKGLREKIPHQSEYGQGLTSRHQLADAFDIGRGVNSHGDIGTCEQRRRWLLDWFGRLRDRLRLVRVCCGDWRRVCDSESVTTRLGTTGIFFDPPYSTEAGRDMTIYAVECGKVAHDVRAYCLERGPDPRYRIALCGYVGEGHEPLEEAGWEVVAWKTGGGYGNRSQKGKDNSAKERIWFSPGCQASRDLFTEAHP